MCGPFLEAVKETERRKYLGKKYPVGKALSDSVKAYYDRLREQGLNSCEAQAQAEGNIQTGIRGGCCGAKPVGKVVTLYPKPEDVQREYDSLRVINPRIEPVYLSPQYVNLVVERVLNQVVRDKLIELGYKGDEAKVKMVPLKSRDHLRASIRTRYKHKFGTPKEKKAVERRVNSEIGELAKAWRKRIDYEDTTIMPHNVTKHDSRLSAEITPAPKPKEHKYAKLVEHGTQGIRETSPDFRVQERYSATEMKVLKGKFKRNLQIIKVRTRRTDTESRGRGDTGTEGP